MLAVARETPSGRVDKNLTGAQLFPADRGAGELHSSIGPPVHQLPRYRPILVEGGRLEYESLHVVRFRGSGWSNTR